MLARPRPFSDEVQSGGTHIYICVQRHITRSDTNITQMSELLEVCLILNVRSA